MNAPAGAPAAMLAGVTLALTHLGLRAARARATVRRLVPRTAGGRGGLPPTRLPRPPRWLAPRLAEVGVAVRAERMWAAWTAATVLSVLVGASVGGVGLALVVTVAAVGAPVVAWGSYRHRGDAMVEAALPPFLEGVARSLRAGAGLRQAVVEATPAAPRALTADLARVVAATERGSTLSAALDDWGRRRPLPGLRLAVSALCLGSETGGAQARALDGVAATLRQRLEAVADARAPPAKPVPRRW